MSKTIRNEKPWNFDNAPKPKKKTRNELKEYVGDVEAYMIAKDFG